jgi:hypothetical protein
MVLVGKVVLVEESRRVKEVFEDGVDLKVPRGVVVAGGVWKRVWGVVGGCSGCSGCSGWFRLRLGIFFVGREGRSFGWVGGGVIREQIRTVL